MGSSAQERMRTQFRRASASAKSGSGGARAAGERAGRRRPRGDAHNRGAPRVPARSERSPPGTRYATLGVPIGIIVGCCARSSRPGCAPSGMCRRRPADAAPAAPALFGGVIGDHPNAHAADKTTRSVRISFSARLFSFACVEGSPRDRPRVRASRHTTHERTHHTAPRRPAA